MGFGVKGVIKKNLEWFLDSLKRGRDYSMVLLINIIFLSCSITAILLIRGRLLGWISKINQIDLSMVLMKTEVELGAINSTLKGFVFFVLLSGIALFIFLVLICSLCQGGVWSIILKKKFSAGFFFKFLFANFIWNSVWAISLLAVIFMIKFPYSFYLTIVLLFLYVHLTIVMHIAYVKERVFNKTIRAIRLGVLRIHYFIIQYILIGIIAIALLRICYYISSYILHLAFIYGIVFGLLVFLMFISMSQFYMAKAITMVINRRR